MNDVEFIWRGIPFRKDRVKVDTWTSWQGECFPSYWQVTKLVSSWKATYFADEHSARDEICVTRYDADRDSSLEHVRDSLIDTARFLKEELEETGLE